jgi:hypothetical protein
LDDIERVRGGDNHETEAFAVAVALLADVVFAGFTWDQQATDDQMNNGISRGAAVYAVQPPSENGR